MVKVKFIQILKPHEWLSLASGLLVAGAIYALLIHPSLKSLTDLPRLRVTRRAAQDELARLQNKLQRAESQIRQDRAILAGMGGGPPPSGQKDLQIARLTALATQCHVKINQYVPIDTVDYQDHRAHMVEFSAQGRFPDMHRFFSLIESTIDFVDVTHFVINVVQADQNSQCLVTWSCRINGITPEMSPRESPGQRADGRRSPMEVVRREP